jgi:phage shock protein PspC (stress-responsive transcriptional regulator)
MSDDDETGIPPRPDFGSGDAGTQGSDAGRDRFEAGAPRAEFEDAKPGNAGTGGSTGFAGAGFSGAGSGGTSSGGGGSRGTGSAGGGAAGGPRAEGPYTGGQYSGGPHAAGSFFGPDRPPLRRERQSRIIAGVCGGLGRHLDIDPVIFRILFVVLTFFGGLGLLVYAAAWLFVPRDGERDSEAQRLLTGGSALAAIAITVVLVLGFMAMVSTIANGFGRAVPLLVLAAAIAAVIVWRNENRTPVAPGQGRQEFAEADFSARDWVSGGEQPRPKPWWQRPVSTYPAPSADTGPISGTEFSGGTPGFTAPRYGEPTESRGSADRGGATSDGSGADGGDREGALAAPSKPGRRLSGLALSGSLLVLGILGVLAAAGAIHVGWAAGTALTVMAIGAAMTIGGLYGRTRWLIPVGLVVAVPLILFNALNVPFRGESGDVGWTPNSVAAATGSTYELSAGRGTLDLTQVDPSGGTMHVTAYVGAGRLTVTVPRDVAVQLTAHVGMGQIQFLNDSSVSGLDVSKSYDAGALGASHGTIALDLKVGAGTVEVDRVAG